MWSQLSKCQHISTVGIREVDRAVAHGRYLQACRVKLGCDWICRWQNRFFRSQGTRRNLFRQNFCRLDCGAEKGMKFRNSNAPITISRRRVHTEEVFPKRLSITEAEYFKSVSYHHICCTSARIRLLGILNPKSCEVYGFPQVTLRGTDFKKIFFYAKGSTDLRETRRFLCQGTEKSGHS